AATRWASGSWQVCPRSARSSSCWPGGHHPPGGGGDKGAPAGKIGLCSGPLRRPPASLETFATQRRSLMTRPVFALAIALVLVGSLVASAAAAPEGQMTWAVHVSIAPTWFDPAETPGIITPYMFLYALHDAILKPMPGNSQAPSLAESWSMS